MLLLFHPRPSITRLLWKSRRCQTPKIKERIEKKRIERKKNFIAKSKKTETTGLFDFDGREIRQDRVGDSMKSLEVAVAERRQLVFDKRNGSD
jgi:hypothetical protein